jgi:hypothetical protein
VVDLSKLEDVYVEDINSKDAPDYCDAFISQASIDGRDLTEQELDWVNEDADFVYESILSQIY